MGLRLPLSVQVRAVLPAGDLAMVLGERRISGTGPDCEPVELSGLGFTVVRHEPAGAWCIVAEAWCLDGPGPASTRD
jgi:ketosteroid isomerase-like protein